MSRKHTPAGSIAPAYTGRLSTAPVPRLRMPDESMDPEAAYRFIHDELMLDGSSRLNLATFVTTWMDPEAEKLMAETFDKNMIDKDEYPATAAIEQRCVCMVADLFHAENLRDDDPSSAIGVSTVGSSEAVMLAGLAMSWRWRAKVDPENKGSGAAADRISSWGPTCRWCGRSSVATSTSSPSTSRWRRVAT